MADAGRERRVAAQEEQRATCRPAPRGRRGPAAPRGDAVLARSARPVAAPLVDHPAAWPSATSQAIGCSGTPSFGQRVAGGDQRLLHGVLGRIEVAVAAHERAEDLRRQLAQQVLDVATPAFSASRPPSPATSAISVVVRGD